MTTKATLKKVVEQATQEGLATLRQAEEFLSVSRSTLYGLMERGELAYAKVGKCRRIPWRVIREFAEKCLVR
jgi:excisionase family DNA binding protein